MLGAIIGDIVGSKYERHNKKTTEFKLIDDDCRFTDDTVCSIANMDWLLHAKVRNEETATYYLRKWTRKYPRAGYGFKFRQWIKAENPTPYGSFGNGAGMRISPVAWAANDLDELKELSDTFTKITHDHPNGMKGALVVATCIYMAIHKSSKEDIKKYAIIQYPEISSLDYETLKKTYTFSSTCQGSIPQALYCFLISNDFEDCIRKAISIGGDSDTIGAMAGSIAEAYYGIPENIIEEAKQKLTPEILAIIDEFYNKYVK